MMEFKTEGKITDYDYGWVAIIEETVKKNVNK